ncbi:CHAT domain-containing protein [Nocardia vinacea]|uniref:CHAT domain-containing protein n=1 Tax=Nocardia vinacea TaxID=96468 RepID=UPI0012F664CB|nr:CHAT domain-containing protein [Nocardia vinacea]
MGTKSKPKFDHLDPLGDELSVILSCVATVLVNIGLDADDLGRALQPSAQLRLDLLVEGDKARRHLRSVLDKANSSRRRRFSARRLLRCSDQLLACAALTGNIEDFELVESVLTAAESAESRPAKRLSLLAGLARCGEARGTANDDLIHFGLALDRCAEISELRTTIRVAWAPARRRAVRKAMIQASLTAATVHIALSELNPELEHASQARILLEYVHALLFRRQIPIGEDIAMAMVLTRSHRKLAREYLILESCLAFTVASDLEALAETVQRSSVAATRLPSKPGGDLFLSAHLILLRMFLLQVQPVIHGTEDVIVPGEITETLAKALTVTPLASVSQLRALALAADLFDIAHGEGPAIVAGVIRHLCYREGLKSSPRVRLEILMNWAGSEEARGNWKTAAEVYGIALSVLTQMTEGHPFEPHRERLVAHGRRLRPLAAHAFARIDEFWRAIEVAEAGRLTLLANKDVAWLPDLALLEKRGREDLASEFRKAENTLLDLSRRVELSQLSRSGIGKFTSFEDLRKIVQSREESISAIRALQGFEDFPSKLDPISDIKSIASTPIVYLIPGAVSGSLLLVDRSGSPVWRELPALTWQDVWARGLDYLEAYRAHLKHPRDQSKFEAWGEALLSITRWLWIAAVGPMIEILGNEPFARIVAMGILSNLPLHAAWEPSPAGSDIPGRYAIDSHALSYLPSASALRRIDTGHRKVLRPLAVSDPSDMSAGSLGWSTLELSTLRDRVGDIDELSGSDATREALRDRLPGHNLLHVSTHGAAYEDFPRRSGFLLAGDQAVSVSDLRDWDTSALDLVVLSSCESALIGGLAPDEMMSMPGAFFSSAGCRVVGTLWPPDQEAAARYFEIFYRCWNFELDVISIAQGMRQATLEVRSMSSNEGFPFEHPAFWAPYLLVG